MTLDLFPEGTAGTREVIPGRVVYVPKFVSGRDTSRLLERIKTTTAWRGEKLRIGNTSIPFPRLIAWYGDPGVTYRYSKTVNVAEGWTPAIQEIRDLVTTYTGVAPNGVLLNYYRDGKDSIGRHTDDESDLADGAPIIGISLGVPRTLRFRAIRDIKTKVDLRLEDGSMLVMKGDCQKTWTHEIGKEPDVAGERISLTFRTVKV